MAMDTMFSRIFILHYSLYDCLFGIRVSTSDYYPGDPGLVSRLYPRNFSGSQSRGDNCEATRLRDNEIMLRKQIKLRDNDLLTARHSELSY